MAHVTDKPFATIESAQQFISLLFESVHEAKCDIDTDISSDTRIHPSRRLDALRIAGVHLHNLEHHIIRTKRILNDLRSLRRLLFDERAASTPVMVPATRPSSYATQRSTSAAAD